MMEKKSSVISQKSTKSHIRSRSFLQQMHSSTGSDKQKPKKVNALMLSKQLSNSTLNRKPQDAIKITHQNFREVFLSLAHRILTANQKGKELLLSVASFLKNEDATVDQEMNSFLIDIDYKKDTFDLLTPLKTIETQIIKSTLKKNNPVGRIAFQIWYKYLYKKYDVDHFENFRKYWLMDIDTFKQYFANIIYQVYGEWVFLVERKKDMFPYIWKEFTPFVLTSHPSFDKIYKLSLKHLGEIPLTTNPNKRPSFFKIQPYFSCEDLQIPFQKTIQIVIDIYKQHGLKKKIVKLKQLTITLKQQLRSYQDYRISKGLQQKYKDIDADNMVGCLCYSILKSGYGGVFQALQYLQLFFLNSPKDKASDYLQGLKIGHIMASLQSSAMYLRKQVNDV